MIIQSSINCPTVICLPTVCYFFLREATSETYGPRVSFSYYLPLWSTFPLLLFSDLLNQKPKNTLLQFILIYFIWRSIYQSTTNLPHVRFPILRRRTPEGIDNPFNTSGCEKLFFVCMCCLRCVAWFPYWFDNLGFISEGNTYHCCAKSSLPLWGNTDVASSHHQSGPDVGHMCNTEPWKARACS